MINLMKGGFVASFISEQIEQDVFHLKERGIFPTLAIVVVGECKEAQTYIRNAIKKCENLGIKVNLCALDEQISNDDFMRNIKELNEDENIHGIMVMTPLPPKIDVEALQTLISPRKDVDGISYLAMASLYSNSTSSSWFAPCTAEACIEMLHAYLIDVAGKNVVVVGRSLTVGKPVAQLLLNENATVTICHSKTCDLDKICKGADIIIAAAGKPQIITKDFVSEEQTIIDVGIHVLEDGKIVGDCAFDQISPIVRNITPVPGGVGALTTSVLAAHVVRAAFDMSLEAKNA